MYQRRRNNKKVLLTVFALVLVCAVSAMGTLAYLTQTTGPVTNTFVAAGGGQIIDPTNPTPGPNLDDDEEGTVTQGFYLLESKAVYANGNYTLGEKDVFGNSYDKAVPSMKIPKDPKLTVNLVEGVDAYIFVKVTNTTGDNVDFTMNSKWTAVSGVAGVYVYNNAITTGADGVDLNGVSLLADDEVTIASNMTDIDTSTDGMQLGELKFEAYACQAGGFANAAAAWTACFASGGTQG